MRNWASALLLRIKSHSLFGSILSKVARKLWALKRWSTRHQIWSALPGFNEWTGRPVSLIRDTDQYLKNHPQGGKIIGFIEAGSTPRVSVEVLQGECPEQMLMAPDISWPRRTVYELNEVKVIGGYAASVLTKSGKLFGELSPDIFDQDNHELFGRFRTPKPQRLSGRTLLIATPEAPSNFSHWLFDLLPRLNAIEAAGLSIQEFDHYLINSYRPGFQAQSLHAFGLLEHDMTLIGPNDAYICESVTLSSFRKDHWKSSLNRLEMENVRKTILRQNICMGKSFPRRMWLSRKDTPFRRLLNESELQPLLDRYGFETFDPEQYSLREQAEAFSQAEVIAGPHTSAMCNWMYCKKGTPVLEIAPPDHKDISFWTVASHAGLRYTALLGKRSSHRCPKLGTRFIDYSVDADQLEFYFQSLVID